MIFTTWKQGPRGRGVATGSVRYQILFMRLCELPNGALIFVLYIAVSILNAQRKCLIT